MKKPILVSLGLLLLLAATALVVRNDKEAKASQKSCSSKCGTPKAPKTGTGFLITDSFSGFF